MAIKPVNDVSNATFDGRSGDNNYYNRIGIELQQEWTEGVTATSWSTLLMLVKLPALTKKVGLPVLVVC